VYDLMGDLHGHADEFVQLFERLGCPVTAKPVFVRHYWLSAAEPQVLAENVACLDFSVAKGGFRCTYRWHGEARLKNEHCLWIEGSIRVSSALSKTRLQASGATRAASWRAASGCSNRKEAYPNACPTNSIPGENAMAKLKKAPGRVIGRWKQEAIAANAGASDADLAKIINEMARLQGYDYKITPEKVRTTTKKPKGKKHARTAAPAVTSAARTTPAPQSTPRGGISLADIQAVKGLVDRVGADTVQELAGMLSK
jgi:hypothetical protein